MSIEKKSLISTLKTTKKANAAKDDITGGATVSPAQKLASLKPGMKGPGGLKPGMKGPGGLKPGMKGPGGLKPGMKGPGGLKPGYEGPCWSLASF